MLYHKKNFVVQFVIGSCFFTISKYFLPCQNHWVVVFHGN